MAKVTLKDLPKDMTIDEEELKRIKGGLVTPPLMKSLIKEQGGDGGLLGK
mgnify:CR=1 FL=1